MAGAKKIKESEPLDGAAEVGPVNNRTHCNQIMKRSRAAFKRGAKLAAGSAERSSGGYFVSHSAVERDERDGRYAY
jgi:aldehyde dehydrogenase (NAD+)